MRFYDSSVCADRSHLGHNMAYFREVPLVVPHILDLLQHLHRHNQGRNVDTGPTHFCPTWRAF